MAPPRTVRETLGFDFPLLVLLLAGILLVFAGQFLVDITGYMDPSDGRENTEATAQMFGNLGTIVAGVALLFAGIRAEGSHTGLRALLFFLGIILVFNVISFTFGAGFGR